MTDDPQRVAEARLSLRIHTPPTVTPPHAPPDLDALYKGAPFAWSNPFLDCRAWALQVETSSLPPLLVALLDPLREHPQLDDVVALAERAEQYELDESLTTDVQWACGLMAARLRFVAAYMGHYISTCMAYHAVSVAASGQHDDAILYLMLTTVAVLREVGHRQVADAYDPAKDADITKLRGLVVPDMERDADVVEFWRRLRGEDTQASGTDEPRGAVRDDTGLDPRDPDHVDFRRDDLGDLDGPSLQVLATVQHLPGGAKDGGRPSGGSTPKAEYAPMAGRRLPCVPPPDLPAVRARLVSRYPHAAAVIDRMLALAVGQRYARLRPVLLVGPPGCGKTRLARELCEAMGLTVTVYSCAGVADSSLIGTNRQWGTGRASVPLQAIRKAMMASVAIVVDEIDKVGTSRHNGNAQDGMLSMLDHASRYHDPYLECDTDLSGATFVATANTLAGVSAPLLDRFLVLQMPPPTRESLPVLVDEILADLREETGQDEDWLPGLDGEELTAVLENFRPGSSIRALRRLVEAVVSARAVLAPRH
ncbi:AAA family ATPase [Methylobacterium sp. D48H]